MFTGIVEEIGSVLRLVKSTDSAKLTIGGSLIFNGLQLGESVAVNGVCLTVSSLTDGKSFTADMMPETLNCSSLGSLRIGSRVNLERALPVGGRFGGHIVTGHIDATGSIAAIRAEGNAIWYTVNAPPHIMRYVVEKGSIAIDGVSLTVARVNSPGNFSVSLIPHTASQTTLAERSVGDTVNLENDIIGKYIEKLLPHNETAPPAGGLTKERLLELGY